MRFLITGITGFAGPHLANLLIKEGHDVSGLVRCSNGRESDILDVVPLRIYKEIKFLYGDLKDKQALDRIFTDNHFDGVFHLAAQSHPPTSFVDPIGTWMTNVTGSLNLISVVEKTQAKLMFCSTSEVYGDTGKEGQQIHVGDKILPSNPYGASKAAIDLYMQERMNNGKLNGFVTRAFSHTGPRRGKTFSISCDAFQLAEIALSNHVHVLGVGNLDTVRVVIDVRDTVEAYYRLMIHEGSSGKVFNVCGDIPRKMEYFTRRLIQIANMPDTELFIDSRYYRSIDIAYQHGDSHDVTELTGWKPKISIDKTLEDLYNYWLKKLI